jgi:hypothetical protein
LTRQTNAPFLSNDDFDDDGLTENTRLVAFDDMNHTVSNFEDTPYLTPTATQLMREMSTGNSTCDLFDESRCDDEEDVI